MIMIPLTIPRIKQQQPSSFAEIINPKQKFIPCHHFIPNGNHHKLIWRNPKPKIHTNRERERDPNYTHTQIQIGWPNTHTEIHKEEERTGLFLNQFEISFLMFRSWRTSMFFIHVICVCIQNKERENDRVLW